MKLSHLESLGPNELDELFCSERLVEIPWGVFRGKVLCWLPRPPGQHPLMRPVLWSLFDLSPFGVDFDSQRWFFLHDRSPRLGHFAATVGQSRWRDAEVVRLEYERSRLPRMVKGLLYDELKPLGEDLCVGIGGLNAEAGQGEQFFFALERSG